MTKWHTDYTFYDLRKSYYSEHIGKEKLEFYRNAWDIQVEESRKNGASPEDLKILVFNWLLEAVHDLTGRRRWFIDKQMFELLLEAEIDFDLRNIFWPYDTVTLVFERGIFLKDYPLRWIRVMRAKSEISKKIVRSVVNNEGVVKVSEDLFKFGDSHFNCIVDTGYSFTTKQRSQTTHFEDTGAQMLVSPYTTNDTTAFDPAMELIPKIVATAFLYYAARPELVIPTVLPRSERYHQKGDRDLCSIMTIPLIKRIGGNSDEETGVTGAKKAPHYRGWVLRTLRSDRYRRNPDGTFRTVLIAPCAIHPESIEEKIQ